jgi:hypothetical protein
MVENNSVINGKVRHVGTFDFKETYRILFEWLVENGYDVNETMYKEIAQPNGLKEVDVFWTATKNVSNYFQFMITVRLHPLAMSKIDVEIDGVKQKIDKGDFTIEYACILVKDYRSTWEESDFSKNLRRWYNKYLVRERTEQHEIKMIMEYTELLELNKSFWALTGMK